MVCSNPVLLQEFGIRVPCGRCIGCRVQRSREWATRIVHESKFHDRNVFVTLTYSSEYMPKNDSISKDELQLFLKRLRKSVSPTRIKYFACGEYGEKNGRPHYHLIVFGLGVSDRSFIEKAWPFGFVYLGTVTYDSARYVADYIQKSYSGVLKYEVYTRFGKVAPFQLQSRGIGLEYALANAFQIRDRLMCILAGRKVGLPRYYKKKLGIDADAMRDVVKRRQEEIQAHYSGSTDDQLWDSVQRARRQAIRNIRARRALKSSRGIM